MNNNLSIMNPLVYIVILNWNKNEQTLDCIRSVLKSSYPNYKISVIDNGSSEKLDKRLADEFPEIDYYYSPENLGFTGGVNIGIERALEHDADYIWLLNNDVEVPEDCLTKLVSFAESETNIGLASPLIVNVNKPERPFYGSYRDDDLGVLRHSYDLCIYQEWVDKNPTKIGLWGTALLIKRRLVERIGMLDSDFFAYYEDDEYSYRSSKAGFLNKTCLDAKITHLTDSKEIIEHKHYRTFLMARNHYLFWIKSGVTRNDAIYRCLERYLPKIQKLSLTNDKQTLNAMVGGLWHAIVLHRFGPLPEHISAPILVVDLIKLLAKPSYKILTEMRRITRRIRRRIKHYLKF